MNRKIWILCLLNILLLLPVAQAAVVPQLVQQVDVTADKAVTPLDYSFFDEPAPGIVELTQVKNLWGAGAQMIFYLVTEDGSDWLMLKFGGGMVELSLQQRKLPLFSERVSAITAASPLRITVQDGKLTAAIGSRTRTVPNVSAFKGSLTTQSIEAKLTAYQFVEQ